MRWVTEREKLETRKYLARLTVRSETIGRVRRSADIGKLEVNVNADSMEVVAKEARPMK